MSRLISRLDRNFVSQVLPAKAQMWVTARAGVNKRLMFLTTIRFANRDFEGDNPLLRRPTISCGTTGVGTRLEAFGLPPRGDNSSGNRIIVQRSIHMFSFRGVGSENGARVDRGGRTAVLESTYILDPSPDGQIPCGSFPTEIVASRCSVASLRNTLTTFNPPILT